MAETPDPFAAFAPAVHPAQITSVLFACTHNSIRSPMAAALLHHLHGRRLYVDSAGVREGDPDPFATAVMEEMGIDISRHRAKTFDQLEDTSFDLVVSLSPEAQHRAVEMTRTTACDVEFWHTFDPSVIEGNRETRLAAYRQVRDTLLARIKQRFPLGPVPVL
ncbi:low molecular weight phosphatase family protein [Nitrospirillum iridis]|uniref:Protein-tyrosine-phosphatase n=1 Tax=Nitrospirillum iridis TaxID=765888 RepID=A0A7X0B0F3_9PROT|nr:arsenate reductase ArsC [Nitrospirillum iridis]MBB6252400.1 protein-tyrosine-phosphatase [Nitrospirillum iridis]